jgi:hypothetical protein
MSSRSKPEYFVYTSLFMMLYPILYAVFALIGMGIFVTSIINLDIEGVIFTLIWESIVLFHLIHSPYKVETTIEGLVLHFYLRPSRLVAWSSIWRVVIRYNKGAWCTIRYGSGLFDRAVFLVDYGFFFRSARAEQFINLIADAADLTIVGHTFWGRPIYGRALR